MVINMKKVGVRCVEDNKESNLGRGVINIRD